VPYRDLHRDQLEQYLSDFIVPAVAVKTLTVL
jgi:hypothetical protein